MFGRKYFEKQFGWQFETDETGLLYRRNMRDAPVRVTVAERDAFIEDFGRKAVPLFWSLVAAALIVQIGPAVYAVAADVEFQIWWIVVGIALLSIGFTIPFRRLWNAPVVHLQGRERVGPARSRADVRRRNLSNMSWPYFGMVIAALLLSLATTLSSGRAATGGRWVMPLIAGIALLAWVVLAIQKLRLRE